MAQYEVDTFTGSISHFDIMNTIINESSFSIAPRTLALLQIIKVTPLIKATLNKKYVLWNMVSAP